MNDDQGQLPADLSPIYATYVGSINHTEGRRQTTNSIYISLSIAFLALIGSDINVAPIFITGPLFLLSLVWIGTIYHYRKLSSAKFYALKKLEERLPFDPFRIEWDEMSKTKLRLTKLEIFIPYLMASFCIIYSINSALTYLQ